MEEKNLIENEIGMIIEIKIINFILQMKFKKEIENKMENMIENKIKIRLKIN